MDRVVLIAPEGKYYTDGATYGKEVHLAVGLDGSDHYLIDEAEIDNFVEASEEEYLSALERLGVSHE